MSINEKLSHSYGSGWRKDAINQCLDFVTAFVESLTDTKQTDNAKRRIYARGEKDVGLKCKEAAG